MSIGQTCFGLFLTISDYISDLDVGIGLYRACHYKFAAVSFFFTSLPSISVLVFVLVTCLHPTLGDGLTEHVRELSGLKIVDLIGLVICFPLWTCIIAIRGLLLENKDLGSQFEKSSKMATNWDNMKSTLKLDLGSQTMKGIQLVEIIAEAMPQFLFTCYIRVRLGPDSGGFIKELLPCRLTPIWDNRIFSVITSFCALWYGNTMISATNMGENPQPILSKIVLITAYFIMIDIALFLSMTEIFIIVFGFWISFGVLIFMMLIEAAIHWKYFGHYGLECIQQGFLNFLAPLTNTAFPGSLAGGSETWENLKRQNLRRKIVALNTFFLYIIYALILISATIILKHSLLVGEQSKLVSSNQNHTINCENLCDLEETEFDNCNVMFISNETLIAWDHVNWTIFIFSFVNFIFKIIFDAYSDIVQFLHLIYRHDTCIFQ